MTATNMCSNFGGKWDSPRKTEVIEMYDKVTDFLCCNRIQLCLRFQKREQR